MRAKIANQQELSDYSLENFDLRPSRNFQEETERENTRTQKARRKKYQGEPETHFPRKPSEHPPIYNNCPLAPYIEGTITSDILLVLDPCKATHFLKCIT